MKDVISNKEFTSQLKAWYDVNHRKLPWREEPSLYKTVVSEFMLQQTQVDTVLPYFARWLETFPDFGVLAQAKEELVLKHWEGLGYYSRARNLHKLAKQYVLADPKPASPKEWIEFPGIGPYSAAAISSIAQDYPAAVIDGNVIRILTRLSANKTEFKDNNSASKALGDLADHLLNREDPNTHNQAMMELGATLCTKANPLCTVCPVVNLCQGAKLGVAHTLPNLLRKKTVQVTINRLLVVEAGKLLLHYNDAGAKRLANLYEFPVLEDIGLKKGEVELIASKKRGISNQRISEEIYRLKDSGSKVQKAKLAKNLKWVGLDELDGITLSGPHRKWLSGLLRALETGQDSRK